MASSDDHNVRLKSEIVDRERGKLAKRMIRAVVSLLGLKITKNLLQKEFPEGEFSISDKEEIQVNTSDSQQNVRKLFDVLVDSLRSNFGKEFVKRILQRVYFTSLEEVEGKEDVSQELLEVIPEEFLEQERVKFFSKEELEQKVLEKTKELQDLNARLEKSVEEKTIALARAVSRLEAQNKELEKMNEAKTAFVSIAAHQLQSPMSAIRWTVASIIDSLDDSCKTPELEHHAENIYLHIDRTVRMIQNLLNVARIEAGRIAYKFERMELNTLVESYVGMFEPVAEQKGVILDPHIEKEKMYVEGDLDKLPLVVENLIDNAIKYTAEGKKITVKLEKKGEKAEISIADQGIGIPKSQQDKIFQKFFRADNAKDTASGTGIGMYLAREVVEAHGGEILFESKEGKGTTVFVRIALTS